MPILNGLYAITDERLTPSHSLVEQATLALDGGATLLQLRDKTSSMDELKKQARALEYLCDNHEATFILNDHVDLAIELECSGLHVGKSDHSRIAQIRKEFKGILGVSCYGDVGLALKMQELGVDYVAFGSFFPSNTKPDSQVVDLSVLQEAKEKLTIPVCAIGGITTENMQELLEYKPNMLAVISDIWQSRDIKCKAGIYTNAFKEKGILSNAM